MDRATKRKKPGGLRPSRNYRHRLRRRCKTDWLLTTHSIYRNHTLSWTVQPHYWTILRRDSEMVCMTLNHSSVSFPFVRYDFLIVHTHTLAENLVNRYPTITQLFAHLCLCLQMIDITISPLAIQIILGAYLQVLEVLHYHHALTQVTCLDFTDRVQASVPLLPCTLEHSATTLWSAMCFS